MSLSPQQKLKMEKVRMVIQDGNIAIAEMILDLEEQIQEQLPAFKKLLEKVKGDKGDNYVLTEKDKSEIAGFAKELINFQDLAKQASKLVDMPVERIAKMASQLIKKPADGRTPSREELTILIEALMPAPIPGKDADEIEILEKLENDLPILGERIRDGLEVLNGDNRLSMDAIKGLKETFDDVLKKIAEVVTVKSNGASGFGGLVNTVRYIDLSDQCNGVKKTFTVPLHRKIVGLRGTQFPHIFRPTVDFTTSNRTLTIASSLAAPETGQTLIFEYIK